jgi:hypothetical protein
LKALNIFAGPKAMAHIAGNGLQPEHINVIPGAAGGPKGLILGPLDRFLFGEWLPKSTQPVDLVGASIGAWRMATVCLDNPVRGLERLSHDYIHQEYKAHAGQRRPSAQQVSDDFSQTLHHFFGGRIGEVLKHPRYRLHVMTSRGKHILQHEHPLLTPLGYAGAYLCNAVKRKAMDAWLERVVFSSRGELPFGISDFATQHMALNEGNFMPALQASCSIPFVLRAVHDIADAPKGAYWDGGITDYHLHLNYKGLVLYPHFQQAVVPGWLDKALKWRHKSTAFLDNTIVLAPNPEWVNTLPNGKLPDRRDFVSYASDFEGRVRVWKTAVKASEQLADEFAAWLNQPSLSLVHRL